MHQLECHYPPQSRLMLPDPDQAERQSRQAVIQPQSGDHHQAARQQRHRPFAKCPDNLRQYAAQHHGFDAIWQKTPKSAGLPPAPTAGQPFRSHQRKAQAWSNLPQPPALYNRRQSPPHAGDPKPPCAKHVHHQDGEAQTPHQDPPPPQAVAAPPQWQAPACHSHADCHHRDLAVFAAGQSTPHRVHQAIQYHVRQTNRVAVTEIWHHLDHQPAKRPLIMAGVPAARQPAGQ